MRADNTSDPDSYRWSGYAEAMAGKAAAREDLARITGATTERAMGQGLRQPPPVEAPPQRKRRHREALNPYRQMLGLAGQPRTREDGKQIRRGFSAKVQARRQHETGVCREQLLQRVRHFTRGGIFGSREFINE